MTQVKVATINILFEMTEWDRRRELLLEGLTIAQPDLIGLQEVKLPENTSTWFAEQLHMPYVHLVPYNNPAYPSGPTYGAAILSRHPFIQQATLDLQGQGRLAQYVQIEVEGQPFGFCNGHYYWHPGPSPERMRQIRLLLDWLGELPIEVPLVAVGDFNGTPDTPEITLMREHFVSAYAAHHGHEPEYTCPTPLDKRRSWWRSLQVVLLNLWANRTLKPWHSTLDYIFVNQHLKVQDCQLILTQPAPDNPRLYPSDHFGIAAVLDLKAQTH